MLNISNPLDPTIIGSTVVTQDTFPNAGDNAAGKLQAIYLGNGQFAVSDTLAGRLCRCCWWSTPAIRATW